ncbi:hypothetical protein Ancab_031257 [Ancistrocladus abbreviatus]
MSTYNCGCEVLHTSSLQLLLYPPLESIHVVAKQPCVFEHTKLLHHGLLYILEVELPPEFLLESSRRTDYTYRLLDVVLSLSPPQHSIPLEIERHCVDAFRITSNLLHFEVALHAPQEVVELLGYVHSSVARRSQHLDLRCPPGLGGLKLCSHCCTTIVHALAKLICKGVYGT